MATRVEIPPDLLERVMWLTGARTAAETVELALLRLILGSIGELMEGGHLPFRARLRLGLVRGRRRRGQNRRR